MKYKSIYREFRPKIFQEIIGQDSIVKSLSNSIKNNTFSHAYLFCGQRGTGKTSTAKILANAINCLSTSDDKPCLKCEICLDILNNQCSDILEIDAASNNGVNEMRELKDKVNFLPLKTKCKVYIIDEVHMLSISAFNALLKTLEEPPNHVIFILATTEFQKVPITIVSRCQQYTFKLVKNDLLKENILNILKIKNIVYESEAIEAIVKLARGSVRDSLTILEQIMMFFNSEKLTTEGVEKIFALVSHEETFNMLKNIYEQNYENIFSQLNEFFNRNINYENYCLDLITFLKETLEYKITNNKVFIKNTHPKVLEYINNFFTTKQISEFVNIFIKTLNEIKNIPNPEIYFELAIIQVINLFERKNIGQVLQIQEVNIEDNPKSKPPIDINKTPSNVPINFKKDISDKKIEPANKPKDNKSNSAPNLLPKESNILKDNKDLNEIYKGQSLASIKENIEQKNEIFQLKDFKVSNVLILSVLNQHKAKELDNKNEFIKNYFKDSDIDLNNKIKLISMYGHIFNAASKNYAIVVTDILAEANWIHYQLSKINYNEIFKDHLFGIIAVSKSQWDEIKQEYIQIKKTNTTNKYSKQWDIQDFYKRLKVTYDENLDSTKNNTDSENFKKGKTLFDNYQIKNG